MKIEVVESRGYKRRGRKCTFTFQLTETQIKCRDPEDTERPVETFAWGYFNWTGNAWEYLSSSSHAYYLPEREPTPEELVIAVRASTAAQRAIAAIEG